MTSYPKIQISEKFKPLFRPKRFKIYYGGRGGMKTVTFSKSLLAIGWREKKRILCLREFMNSIDDSVHSSLASEVEKLGLGDFYKVDKTQITAPNETLFRFWGLARNLTSIKSKDAFDIAWIEEGNVSQKSLDVLIPTVRKSGSEIWISFNPMDEDDAVYREFVHPNKKILDEVGIYEDEFCVVVKVGLEDNPFAPQELLDDSRRLKEKNLKKWLHVYGGELGGDFDGDIFEVDGFQYYDILPPDFEYQAIFCDTAMKDGEQNDYTVFQCWAKRKGRIYLVDQFREKIKATYLKERLTAFWNDCKAKTSIPQPLKALYIEDKVSGIQLIQDIQRKGGIPVIPIPRPPKKGKVLRANNGAPWIKTKLVYVPRNAPWLHKYVNEFEAFTSDDSHAYDDQVDATLDAIEHMLVGGANFKKPKDDKPKRKPLAPGLGSKSW